PTDSDGERRVHFAVKLGAQLWPAHRLLALLDRLCRQAAPGRHAVQKLTVLQVEAVRKRNDVGVAEQPEALLEILLEVGDLLAPHVRLVGVERNPGPQHGAPGGGAQARDPVDVLYPPPAQAGMLD